MTDVTLPTAIRSNDAGFVELDRKFEVYRDEESADEAARRSYVADFVGRQYQLDWQTLLTHRLVVVLGEPGSGKSEELRAQHRRNPDSFFLRLEQLVTEDIDSILSDEELDRFERWKSSRVSALFLLDAVDESKLKRDDDFIVALERLSKALGHARFRARLVVSSRISEWRPQTDREAVRERFAAPGDSDTSNASDAEILVTTILPLTAEQVRLFADNRGIQNAQCFLDALGEHNAWPFAGRPLDVSNLYAYWREKGTLSGLTALTDYMVKKLLAEVSSKEKGDPLTSEQARSGAEYLAAAAVLCKNLKFEVADDGHVSDQRRLSPELILPSNWKANERRALLDRAIFDSESRGALSFHHRSHVEYLAACWIERLMEHNCPFEALQDILFVQANGTMTLRASLAPVAAWLVKSDAMPWRTRLANLLVDTAPEIHFHWGDPSALPIEYRKRLLEAIVRKYRGREYVSIDVSLEALARVADAGLAEDISTYLTQRDVSDSLKADFLMMVMEGRLPGCVDSVLKLFDDGETSASLRRYCVLAVRDAGTREHLRQLSESCSRLEHIDNKALGYLFETLFPACLSVEGALALLQRATSVSRYDYEFLNSVKTRLTLSLDDAHTMPFLRGFVEMMAREPTSVSRRVSEQYHWVSELLPLCLSAALALPKLTEADVDTVFEAVLHVEHDIMFDSASDADVESHRAKVRDAFARNAELRRAIFWKRVAWYRTSQNGKEPQSYVLNPHVSLLPWSFSDVEWMIADSLEGADDQDRKVAMEAALSVLWTKREPLHTVAWRLRRPLARKDLRPWVLKHVRNRLFAPVWLRYDKYVRHRLLDVHWWTIRRMEIVRWRNAVKSHLWLWTHLTGVRSGKYPLALRYLVEPMQDSGASQYSAFAWDKMRAKWGAAFTSAAQEGCTNIWKTFSPQLPYERKEKNSVDGRVVLGLIALQTAWEAGNIKFEQFNAADVSRAVRYACSELNGLPEWFDALAGAFPDDVVSTLLLAIDAEFKYPADWPLVHEVLAKLAGAKTPTMAASQAVHHCLSQRDPLNNGVLKQATTTLLRTGAPCYDDLLALAPSRVQLYDVGDDHWLTWMSLWLRLDVIPAIRYLETAINARTMDDADELVIRLCSILGGSYGTALPMGRASFLAASSLAILIPLVCRHVRRADDIDRTGKGAYSPLPRDDAQDFRARLWEVLRTSDSHEADTVLQGFLGENALPTERDWVLSILEERKGKQADPTAWFPEDVQAFGTYYRHKPRSNYQLYQLTTRLLLDIKANIEASENATDRLQVRREDKEVHFQGFLKRQLDQRSLQWFAVTQESTIDLNQRPDLRVELPGVNALPVEVKLANLEHWTAEKLLERLEVQLVGQYLRASGVNYGVYVVGNTEPKRQWQRPGGKQLIGFAELVSLLQARAETLMSERSESVHGLRVIGIDFSDPRERRS
ncbi:NACHT domain-containing protein [Burkholderia pseudomallei]